MATIGTQTIAQASVKLRWREPYVTSGVNRKDTVLSPGCYRGLWITNTAVPSTSVLLDLDAAEGTASGVAVDSFALISNPSTGYALAVRESGAVTLDLATIGVAFPTAGVTTLYISTSITYTEGSDTVANYVVSDTDPTVADPYCVVIGRLVIDAGAAVVNIGVNTAVSYADRTQPQATAREAIGDYVAGDQMWGLLEGTERWCLPTTDEKKALDGAATAATASNPYVTEADTTEKIFAEPSIYQMTIVAGNTYSIPAANGPFYIGKGAQGTAKNYFALRLRDTNDPVTRPYGGTYLYILNVFNSPATHILDPSTEADANGFYTGEIIIQLNTGAGVSTSVNVDLFYGKKHTYGNLDQTPASTLAHPLRWMHDHADTVTATTTNAPTGLPLQFDTTVSDWFTKLAHKTRGTRNVLQTEASVGERLYSATRTAAQVHGSGAQQTIGSVAWPRCLAVGYDNITTTTGTTEGNRYFMYTATDGVIEKVYRWKIQDYDDLTSGVYMDVVAQAYADNVIDVPAKSSWRIVSMICNGQYLFVRMLATTTGGTQRSVIDCWDIVNLQRHTGWATSITIGDPTVGASTWDDSIFHNAMHIILANATTIAVNEYWEDVLDGSGAARGIALYSTTDGSLIAKGYGNSATYSLDTEAEIVGPLVSDGTNIYFGVLSDRTAATRFYWGIGQCTITDPTTAQAGNTFPELDTTAYIPAGSTVNCGRSLIFDGKLLWLNTRFCAFGGNPAAAALPVGTEATTIEFDNSYLSGNYYEFGPAEFDGRYLWFAVAEFDPTTFNVQGLYHMVRFNPGNTYPSFDGVTYWPGNWGQVFASSYKWALVAPTTAIFDVTPASYIPFGNIITNGDTLYWTGGWNGTGGYGLLLQRLICIQGL